MIGVLPKQLEVDGIQYQIRTDYRVVLTVFEAFNDPELSLAEKWETAIRLMFIDWKKIKNKNEAAEKISWFINLGKQEDKDTKENTTPCFDWKQDEQLIFSAVNNVAGREIRELQYLHYWTFAGYFNEMGEGLFSTVISIRTKKRKHKKLTEAEQEFYRNNKAMVDLQRHYSKEELEEKAFIDAILGGV